MVSRWHRQGLFPVDIGASRLGKFFQFGFAQIPDITAAAGITKQTYANVDDGIRSAADGNVAIVGLKIGSVQITAARYIGF